MQSIKAFIHLYCFSFRPRSTLNMPDGNCRGVSSYSCNRWEDKRLLRKEKPDCIFLSVAPDDLLLVANWLVCTQAIQSLTVVPNFICRSVLPAEITSEINPCREEYFIWRSVKSRPKGFFFFSLLLCQDFFLQESHKILWNCHC